MDSNAIAAANVPILCLDTCSILDVMRDPSRETSLPHERRSAIALIEATEAGGLVSLMASQVQLELNNHLDQTHKEADSGLYKVKAQIFRVNELSEVFGVGVPLDLRHLDDYVQRTRNMVERWRAGCEVVSPSEAVHAKAFARLNANAAPARKGKDSGKDCLVFETYLEAIGMIRAAGAVQPIVFLSSNTKDYCDDGKARADLMAELGVLNAQFASNAGAAKAQLGI